MGWIDELTKSTVYIDTAPLIYYIERNAAYIHLVRSFFTSMHEDNFAVVTSTITLLEVLIVPTRQNDKELAQKYRDILLNTEQLDIVKVDIDIAEEAARLRSQYKLKIADAIHMATATVSSAKYFLTNDLSLPSLPNLTVLKLDQLRTLPEYTEQNENQ